MIYFATVHWHSARWIDLQTSYIHKHTHSPHRIFAWLNGIPQEFFAKFDGTMKNEIASHTVKLNSLAEIICEAANDDDLLVFIDGDALPIAPLDGFLTTTLEKFPLMAVCRLENCGDSQPHPCFCATTAGFWRQIKGDWGHQHPWLDPRGKLVYDTGGTLKHLLDQAGCDWHRMLRTRDLGVHPVFFGIYDDVVYHHGAGFRTPLSRFDIENGDGLLWFLFRRNQRSQMSVFKKCLRTVLMSYLSRKNRSASDYILKKISTRPDFFDMPTQ
jgi:hypothetical protein